MMDLQTLLIKAKVKASELNPYLRDKCLQLVELAYKNGYQILITQGYRSIAEQNDLYAQGRTKPGSIVTNAKGGESNHNYRLAFDIAVLFPDGSIDWNTESKYKAVGKLGQSIGLDWGGAWTGFVDLPHFEYMYGFTVKQLQSGVKIPDYPVGYQPNTGTKEDSKVPQVIKERVASSNGKLVIVPPLANGKGDYGVSATDVRYVKFNKDSYTMKLVWEKGAKVSDLVKKYGADYGFNFPFFWAGNPVADCKIGSQILNQGYDEPNGAKQTKWHGFAFKNGQPVIGTLDINSDYSNGFLVKTSPLLIENGNPCWDYYRVQEGTAIDIGVDSKGNYVRAQRTFVGLDPQGNLHVAAGDGRTQWDRGLNLEEMALYMASKGCTWALNGDGGSSTVLADSTGSLGQNQGSSEVVTNHAVLIFLNKTTPTPPQGGNTVEQWKLDSLKALSQYKQKNGEDFIDYATWADKLNDNAPTWLVVELLKRLLEKQ